MTTPRWVANVTVPDDDREAFSVLTNLDDDAAKALFDSLANVDVDGGLQGLAVQFAKLGIEEADDVASALLGFNIFRLKHGISSRQGADAIVRSLKESDVSVGDTDLEPFLSAAGLISVAKVNDLSQAYPIRFFAGRIITELRPIFDEPGDEVTGGIVAHQLILDAYQDEGITDRTIMMTDDDLIRLQNQITRALKKSQTLSGVAKASNIPIYGNQTVPEPGGEKDSEA